MLVDIREDADYSEVVAVVVTEVWWAVRPLPRRSLGRRLDTYRC